MSFFLAIVIIIHWCARLSGWRHKAAVWIAGALIGLSVWLFLPVAWENSLMVLKQKIRSGTWADHFVLLVSLDVWFGMWLAYRDLRREYGLPATHQWLRLFPPLLLFPAIFWLSAGFFYILPGLGYTLSGFTIMLIFTIGIPTISWVLQWMPNGKVAVVELRMILNLLIMVIIWVMPALSAASPAHTEPVHWLALAVTVGVCLAGTVTGYLFFRILKHYKTNFSL